MKKYYTQILLLGLFLLASSDIQAQIQSNLDFTENKLLGIWEHRDGNEIFMVEFFYDNEAYLVGDFEMVTVNSSGLETVTYKSNKKLFDSNYDWPPAINSVALSRDSVTKYEGGWMIIQ